MSNDLAAGKALELLTRLRTTIEAMAGRANKLSDDFHLQKAKERQRETAATTQLARESALAAEGAASAFQARQTAMQARYEARKAWIGKAYQASKEKALQRIDDQVGARKYELQKKMLQAERDRDEGLQAATRRYQEFQTQLAAEEARLTALEQNGQQALNGYRGLRNRFLAAYERVEAPPANDEDQLLSELRKTTEQASAELNFLKSCFLLRIFRYWIAWVLLGVAAAAVPLVRRAEGSPASYLLAVEIVAGSVVLLFLLRLFAVRQARPWATAFSDLAAKARHLHDRARQQSETRHTQDQERLRQAHADTTHSVDQDLKLALARAGEQRVSCRMRSDERTVATSARWDQMHQRQVRRAQEEYDASQRQAVEQVRSQTQSVTATQESRLAQQTAAYETAWKTLEVEWHDQVDPLIAGLQSIQSRANALFPPWNDVLRHEWKPPAQFSHAARFAELKVELDKLCDELPKDSRLSLSGLKQLTVPLCLGFPEEGSILFETAETGRDQAIQTLNNVVLRLLTTAPPGRLNFTILDPVGLGQNFAGIMHLADYEEQLINNRIWTQSTQIEQKLADLNEHMEKVIQMYLRNEYQTIAEYNQQAGVIAEKYYFLVVADFPANFTETAAKRLLSIAASGARCGVYTLLHWDRRLPIPQDFIPDDLRKSSVCLSVRGTELLLIGYPQIRAALTLEPPPSPEMATQLVHQIGRLSRDSSRVEVPFEHVAPPPTQWWSEDTTGELRVPIGRTGATKFQYLAIGKGTCQHGLIAGKTGSGKSTLFHVIITNLALWCGPEQAEFYLVDFKKGVEFKCYAANRLPHARVVAIESDREFGLSVLQRINDELQRRGDLFRRLGVQDIAGYKRAGGTEPMPRTLLLVDEFQEFFIEDDRISQNASLLLDRIVRQGRAFGVHVLLGSQTLGGAYTVARTTLGQMVVRIALQCNEADSYLIMDDTNPAPRLLSRPGEGIYNDMAGALEGNSPFQVVWLPDGVRDQYLSRVRQRADQSTGTRYPGPIVFEGNAPADIRENLLLSEWLERETPPPPAAFARLWLGAPNSIKGPTEVPFARQSGHNLLIVGQRDEAVQAMRLAGLIALAAQFPPGGLRLIVCDATPAGTPARDLLEQVVRSLPHPVTLAKPADLVSIMGELQAELQKRSEDPDPDAAPPVFLWVHELQKFGRLRFEEDYGLSSSDAGPDLNPAAILNRLLSEGTRLGLHVIVSCDTYNTVTRFLSRKAMSEFEMRVLFQMSANDSANLIDSPKAGLLGLHRALFFNAQEGQLETFRPYAVPPAEWLQEAAQRLRHRSGAASPVLPTG